MDLFLVNAYRLRKLEGARVVVSRDGSNWHGSRVRSSNCVGFPRQPRVVESLGTVPAIGVCTLCNREFKVPMTAMKRVADAKESLRVQFSEHKGKREATSRAAKN
jgi:hypothetical protein